MNNLQHILQVVFRKESLDEVHLEELEQLSREHPLFAPLHFLLAKKYKQTGNELYEKQIRKTALHFHNPLWLHYQLSQTVANGHSAPGYTPAPTELHTPKAEQTFVQQENNPHDLIEEVVVHQELEPIISNNETETDLAAVEKSQPAAASNVDAHVGEMYNTNADSEALKMQESEAKHELSAENDVEAEHSSTTTDSTSSTFEDPREQVQLIKPQHPLFSKTNDEEAEDLKVTFEPFHTVDYFASQGIKVNQEIKSEDRLGKQLKSFTEWLKTMRKLPEATVEAELEKINDREIASIAAHSLDEKEVVTEAMAEVYAKQGLHEQATAVYSKLSLLNPSKSAYFAAKIEALKNQ